MYSNFRPAEKLDLIELKLPFSKQTGQARIKNLNIRFFVVLNVPHILTMFTRVIAHWVTAKASCDVTGFKAGAGA